MRIDHERLKRLRLQRGWTQEDAARRIGIDVRQYRRYEKGRAIERSSHLLALTAQAFDLSGPEKLLIDDDLPPLPVASVARQTASGDRASYLHLEKVRQAVRHLQDQGSPLVLQGPWLFGKSTLLRHVIEAWEQQKGPAAGIAVRIKLEDMDSRMSSLDELLAALAEQLVDEVRSPHSSPRPQDIWGGYGSPKTKFNRVLRDHVLPATDGLLLVAIENAEVLLGCPFHHELFAYLRSWAETHDRELRARLRLTVTHSLEPALLETKDPSSFFAIAYTIELDELDATEIDKVAAQSGLNPAPEHCRRLQALIGGHPHLWDLAFREAANRALTIGQLLDQFEPAVIFGSYLRRLHLRLQDEGLAAVKQVLLQPHAGLSLSRFGRLYSCGLIAGSAFLGHHRLRCKLFEDYFRAALGA